MISSWKILLVDDDPSAHEAAKILFKRIKIKEKKLEILSAYSVPGAIEVLTAVPDIALMIVDMAMEEDTSGSKLIKKVREGLKLKRVRIIVRSEYSNIEEMLRSDDFMEKYDIGGICEKTCEVPSFVESVTKQVKEYKVKEGIFHILKIFIAKILFDLFKRIF